MSSAISALRSPRIVGRPGRGWLAAAICGVLLFAPPPGAVRLMMPQESEIPQSGQEEHVREALLAGSRRHHEAPLLCSRFGRAWPVARPRLAISAARRPQTGLAAPNGHRLPDGHNAPLAC
jgi:hypothetical protein